MKGPKETPSPKEELASLRRDVKIVDESILRLLGKRLAFARRIGEVKAEANIPIQDVQVEKDVVDACRTKARELGLYESMAEDLARILIKYSLQLQDEYQQRRQQKSEVQSQKILVVGGRGQMGRWLSEFFDAFGHTVHHFDVVGIPGAEAEASEPYPLVEDLALSASDFDVIALATPIGATPSVLETLVEAKSQALIFDICSLKSPITGALAGAAAAGLAVASVHPMFGPSVELLTGRNIIICHVADTDATQRTKALFEGTTARLVEMPLSEHDRLMGYVLGLSHLSNLVFAEVLAQSGIPFQTLLGVASSTFNSQLEVTQPVTRENQDLDFEIQAGNAFSSELLGHLETALINYGDAIRGEDRKRFRELMESGRKYLEGVKETSLMSEELPPQPIASAPFDDFNFDT